MPMHFYLKMILFSYVHCKYLLLAAGCSRNLINPLSTQLASTFYVLRNLLLPFAFAALHFVMPNHRYAIKAH